jgi:hypothetical protein
VADDDEDNQEDLAPRRPPQFLTELQQLEESINHLREIGTKDALRHADDLETRMVVLKNKVDRLDHMTVERLGEWVKQIIGEASKQRKPALHETAIDMWPEHLRDEAYQAMQTALAAARFRDREAADMLGIHVSTMRAWKKSEGWPKWMMSKSRRTASVVALADLALERLGHTLSLDTNDPAVMALQVKASQIVLTAGLSVPDAAPAGGIRRTGGHSTAAAEPARPRPERAVRSLPKKAGD